MNYKNGDVIRYKPDNNWCKHGIAVVYRTCNSVLAKDTYWGIGAHGDSGWIHESDIEGSTLIGNIYEFRADNYRNEKHYADTDKFYIPMGGGSAQMWYRVGAQPIPSLVAAHFQCLVEKAETGVRAAEGTLLRRKQELEEYLKQHPEISLKKEI